MNKLNGSISEVKTQGTLSLATVRVENMELSILLIDTPDSVDYLKVDQPVSVLFKETEVILGRGASKISILNEMDGLVTAIEEGKLLSKVSLDVYDQEISAVLMTESLTHLNIRVGETIKAYVKSNEIMITE